MRLLFVEFPEHVAEALVLADGCDVIALTPHAGAALEAAGVKFRYPEHVFPWRELEEEGIGLLADFQRMTARLDAILTAALPQLAAATFTPARFATYELLLMSGSVWTKVYRMLRVLEALRPDQVTYFATAQPKFNGSLWFERESVYGDVLGLLCRSLGIAANRNERPFPSPCRWAAVDGEPRMPWPGPMRRLSMVVERAKSAVWRWLRHFQPAADVPRLLVIQEPVPAHLFARNAAVWTWINADGSPVPSVKDLKSQDKLDGAALESAWNTVSRDEAVRGFFRLRGHDWFSLVSGRLHHFVTQMLASSFAKFCDAEAIIDKVRPDALVYANMAALPLQAVAHAARRRHIPVVCEPHGPMGHYVNHVCILFDAIGCSHFLTGGPGARDYVLRHWGDSMELPVTGAAMMDQLRCPGIDRNAGLKKLGLSPDKKIAIFAIQNVAWNAEYPPYAMRDDRRTFEIDRRILDVLGETKDLQIILKGHPATSYPVTPLKAYGEAKYGKRFAYIAQWPLSLMLDMADAVILGYAVTTIYQALSRKKRVYVLNDFHPIDPPNLKILEDAVYCADDVEKFCAMLRADLQSGSAFQPSAKDHVGFLRQFADPDGGGSCSERIVKAIDDIATQNRARLRAV